MTNNPLFEEKCLITHECIERFLHNPVIRKTWQVWT